MKKGKGWGENKLKVKSERGNLFQVVFCLFVCCWFDCFPLTHDYLFIYWFYFLFYYLLLLFFICLLFTWHPECSLLIFALFATLTLHLITCLLVLRLQNPNHLRLHVYLFACFVSSIYLFIYLLTIHLLHNYCLYIYIFFRFILLFLLYIFTLLFIYFFLCGHVYSYRLFVYLFILVCLLVFTRTVYVYLFPASSFSLALLVLIELSW